MTRWFLSLPSFRTIADVEAHCDRVRTAEEVAARQAHFAGVPRPAKAT